MYDFNKSNQNPYIPFEFSNGKNLKKNAILILETGDFFLGYSFGGFLGFGPKFMFLD